MIKRKISGILTGISLAFMMLAYMPAIPTLAVSTDNLSFGSNSIRVFSDYAETGDWLIVAEVDCTITTYSQNVQQYFQFQLLGTDNTTVIASRPLYFKQDAPISIYLNPSVVSGLSYSAAYYVRVVGLYTTPDIISYQLQNSDWYGSDKSAIDQWLRSTATNMNTYHSWDGTIYSMITTVTDVGEVLTVWGGGYFTPVISRIAEIRPDMFLASKSKPLIPADRTANPAFDASKDFATQVGTGISSDMTVGGGLLGISGRQFFGILIILGVVALIALFGFGGGEGILGLVAGILLLIGANYSGAIATQITAIIAAVAIFYFVYKFTHWGTAS